MDSVHAGTELDSQEGRKRLEAGGSLKFVNRLWFMATSTGKMSDLALLS